MMKKKTLPFLFLLSLSSCSSETDEIYEQQENEIDVCEAYFPEEVGLRSTLVVGSGSSYTNRWSYNDDYILTDGSVLAVYDNKKYYNTNPSKFTRTEGDRPSTAEGTTYYYIHPKSDFVSYLSEGVFKIKLPEEQYYNLAEGATIPECSFPKIGASQSLKFPFYNLTCAVLFKLKTDVGNVVVKSITVSSDENLSGQGTASITLANKSGRNLEMDPVSGDPKTVTLNCGEGVEINSSKQTYFYIAIPYGTHKNMKFVVNTESGSQFVVKPSVDFKLNTIKGTSFSFVYLTTGGTGEMNDIAD